jgi:zinc finger protein 830
MSDVRALLKAKRQEARVIHPLASYSDKTGLLKCSICHTIIKHASAWDGHIGSKNHRTNVARQKEEERLKAAQMEQDERATAKRKAEDESPSGQTKRRKVGEEEADDADGSPAPDHSADGMLPGDFFSDSSRAPLPPPSDDDDDDDDDPEAMAPVTPAPSVLDLEWEKFQRTVLYPPDAAEAYDRATVFAEPELASETPEGFPPQQSDTPEVEVPNKMDAEQARRQKEQDERELIMDRLLDEEAAQEEADMKVTVMKGRLEALRKKREAAKALKAAR